ncbi:MAG: 2-oxo acid dehydrogenase subunit E2 [Bacteroidetes bacterium]|nr:2-oxo acid dehydrogenase subunit E2 [Bacteroidota bacterium]MBM3424294.1 2-oxo acid dehydrogenase subunit E2 [Bacteroidota bacterium]
MAEIEIRLPKMGESVTEATITNWLKNIGDAVAIDEPLVEVATDKVDNELPSEASGILIKQLFQKDEVAQVGDVIAILSANGTSVHAENSALEVEAPPPAQNQTADANSKTSADPTASVSTITNRSNRFYSPLVKSIAQQEGLDQSELDHLVGTGSEGRVTKKDLLAYLANRGQKPTFAAIPPAATNVERVSVPRPAVQPSAGDEIIEMDRMRRLIADHMVMSKQVSPHVTSFVEADVTNLVNWRNRIKQEYQEKTGENITFTPIFIEAVVKAIQDFPMINVSVNGTSILKKKDIHIGMATALPSGNLIVPVIKHADRLNLSGLAKAVNELANNARNNKLNSEDVQGGTYTITNVGTFGNVMGTPIINQPQVAIMAFGAIRKIPAVIETPEGDCIGIRQKMFLSHSYDHRVIDGALGGQFVKRVAQYLEQFDILQKI